MDQSLGVFYSKIFVEESADSADSRVSLKSDLENLDYSLHGTGSWQ